MAEWPRMPYLNDELREWITSQLATLGVDEIALYAVDPQRGQDEERRVLVATEVGLIDGWYAPRGGSSARYGFTARLWPWQAVRGVDLRNETYRVWALEHRTRWWLRLARPGFEAETDAPELGVALCDLAKVCAVMAEPAGWQAAQEDVPQRREPLRVVPPPAGTPPDGADVEETPPTGRPIVPPPVVMSSEAVAAPPPQPLHPEMPVDEPAPQDMAPEPERREPAPAPEPEPEPMAVETPEPEPAPIVEAEAVEPEPEAPPEVMTVADVSPADEAIPAEEVAHSQPDEQAEARTEQPAAEELVAAVADEPHETPPLPVDAGPEAPPEESAAAPVERDEHPAEPVAAASPATNGTQPAERHVFRGRGINFPGAFRRPHPAPERNGSALDAEEEEVLDLGAVGEGDDRVASSAGDPDPLGLQGPLQG